MFLYMASRRLYAKPVEAYAELVPALIPKKRERKAKASMSPPYKQTLFMSPFPDSPPLMPLSIMEAVT